MRRLCLLLLTAVSLAACAPSSNGILVSPQAEPVGGNLFVEKLGNGGEVLVLDGEITPETAFFFQSVLEQADVRGLVIAQSPGGNLLAAHQIGRAIADGGLNTAVLVSCISACVDIFIAGKDRSMAPLAELGLHSASDPEFGYAVDKPYWTRFGFANVNEAAYQVPFGKLWIMDAKRARELRLATDILN